eukprot:1161450-Pelagomonas_calceolata.AAC.7
MNCIRILPGRHAAAQRCMIKADAYFIWHPENVLVPSAKQVGRYIPKKPYGWPTRHSAQSSTANSSCLTSSIKIRTQSKQGGAQVLPE